MSSTFEESDAVVGQRIQNIRNQEGMSQAEFAEALGISLRAYQNYERGDRPVSKQLLCSLKSIFGASLDYILDGGESGPESTPLGQLSTWADAAQMSDLLHYIYNELNQDLPLDELMPGKEPFWFITSVYQRVIAHLPSKVQANSEEAYKLANHFAKDEIERYRHMLSIARKNTGTSRESAIKNEAKAKGGATQTFHGKVGQVGGGDINNNFGDNDK
jgi:transcriptional regulator with XRE-family HTH domain